MDEIIELAERLGRAISESSQAGSMSSIQIHKQLLEMADTWQGMVAI